MAEKKKKELTEYRVDYTTPISQVPAIRHGTSTPRDRETLAQLVEMPIREACLHLYDLNIKTYTSSANKKDITSGGAHIFVEYESLSETNKKIAQALVQKDPDHYSINKTKASTLEKDAYFVIKVPITSPDITVGEINYLALGLVMPFKKQKLTWATTYTLEEFVGRAIKPPEREDFIRKIEQHPVLHYDRKTDLVYHSKEIFFKSQEEIPEEKPRIKIRKQPKKIKIKKKA